MTTLELNDRILEKYESEQQQTAQEMMAYYDARKWRRFGCGALSLVWLSVGGQTLFPIGLLAALMVLLPQMPAWSLARRLRFTGRRAWVLVGLAVLGLLFVQARIALLSPAGGILELGFAVKLLPWG